MKTPVIPNAPRLLLLLNIFIKIARVDGTFAVIMIWIVQKYLQLLLCPVVSIIAIHFCLVSPTLTSVGFSMYRIDWPSWSQSLLHLLAVFH